MMKLLSKSLMLLVVIGWLSPGLQVTFAQDAVDPGILEIVSAAFENTRTANSLHLVSQSLTESADSANGSNLNTQQTQELDFVKTETGWNVQGAVTTTRTLPFGEILLGGETVIVDDVTYVRFNQIPGGIPLNLPAEWVELDAFTASQSAGGTSLPPQGTGLSLGASADELLAMLMIPMSAEAVTEISALPLDQIEGQAMQVYQITVDSAAVLESEAASLFNTALAGGAGGLPAGFEPGNFTPSRGELPAVTDLQPPSPEAVQMTFAVYIGEEDGLVHRIYSVVNILGVGEGENARPGLTMTTITDYSRFNEPVEITAPEINS